MKNMNFSNMMKQAEEMQKKMQELQSETEKKEVIGDAGAGMVQVRMNGKHKVLQITIDPTALTEDKEVLEDLIASACNDAVLKNEKNQQESLSSLTGGLGLPANFKLPF